MTEKKNRVPASPKTRKFARELGIDINQVSGSKREGRVIDQDIKKFIKNISTVSKKEETKKEANKPIINIEFEHSEFGDVEIKDIPRVKKLAAPHLVNSWTSIPHVTNHDEADITEMENFRNSLKDLYTGEKKKNYPFSIYHKSFSSNVKKISYI